MSDALYRGWARRLGHRDRRPHLFVEVVTAKGWTRHESLCGFDGALVVPDGEIEGRCVQCVELERARMPAWAWASLGAGAAARRRQGATTRPLDIAPMPVPRPPIAPVRGVNEVSAGRRKFSPALDLLSLIDPGGSGYIAEMQNTGRRLTVDEAVKNAKLAKAARAKACVVCNGRRKFRFWDPEAGPAREDGDGWEGAWAWEWCGHCGGLGTMRETGGMSTTRVSKRSAETMTSSDVAAMLVGVAPHKVDAAMVYMLDDADARERLEHAVLHRIVAPMSEASPKRWTDPEREPHAREWLAWFAVTALRMGAGQQVKARHAAGRLRIPLQTWHTTWKPRHNLIVERVEGWVQDVGAVLDGQQEARRTG